jgi:biopolymer transport protein ExbD
MKFPRNARIFRGQLDAAPFLSVFFLLLIFVMMGSLVYTPGVVIELPSAGRLPGVEGPTEDVGVDAAGRFYFRNQLIEASSLVARLQAAAANSPEPLTLIVRADKNASLESLDQLAVIAQQAGIRKSLLATIPQP